jgi:hypothetical protein
LFASKLPWWARLWMARQERALGYTPYGLRASTQSVLSVTSCLSARRT